MLHLLAQEALKRIGEAVAIAVLTAVGSKAVDLAYDEIKARREAARKKDGEAEETIDGAADEQKSDSPPGA